MWDEYSMSFLFIAEAEKVVGWARSHYLSSTTLPSIKGDRLIIPRERYICFALNNSFRETLNIGLVGHLLRLVPYYYCFTFMCSLDIAIERLKEQGITTKKSSQNLKVFIHLSIP